MKTIKSIMIMAVGLLLIAGCGGKKDEAKTEQKIAVELAPVQRGDITVIRTYSGTLEGAIQSKAWATIPERVVDIPAREGTTVKSGDPIVILDKEGASSRYTQAQAVYINARDNFEKMKNLYDQRAISDLDYKNSKTAFEVAQADFNAAKASVELSVPIDGIVTDIAVNIGDLAPLGIPIATVANTKKMRLTVYVTLDVIEKLKVGQKATVTANSSDPINAKIITISRSADPETRLFRVELEMNNVDGMLRPGMYAKAQVVLEELKNVLVVDREAVFTEEGIPKAYYISDGKAHTTTLELGASDDNYMQVLSGLKEGQDVVVVGKSSLRDGAPIMLREKKDSGDVSS
jgi:RND family efflux transporter MFP subunit